MYSQVENSNELILKVLSKNPDNKFLQEEINELDNYFDGDIYVDRGSIINTPTMVVYKNHPNYTVISKYYKEDGNIDVKEYVCDTIQDIIDLHIMYENEEIDSEDNEISNDRKGTVITSDESTVSESDQDLSSRFERFISRSRYNLTGNSNFFGPDSWPS